MELPAVLIAVGCALINIAYSGCFSAPTTVTFDTWEIYSEIRGAE